MFVQINSSEPGRAARTPRRRRARSTAVLGRMPHGVAAGADSWWREAANPPPVGAIGRLRGSRVPGRTLRCRPGGRRRAAARARCTRWVLAQVQAVGVAGLAAVSGQEPSQRQTFGVGEDGRDRHGRGGDGLRHGDVAPPGIGPRPGRTEHPRPGNYQGNRRYVPPPPPSAASNRRSPLHESTPERALPPTTSGVLATSRNQIGRRSVSDSVEWDRCLVLGVACRA